MRKIVWLSAILLPVAVFFSYNPEMPAPDNPELELALMPAPDNPVVPLAAQMPAPDNPEADLHNEIGLESVPTEMPAPDNPEVEGYSTEEMPLPNMPEELEEMPAPDNPKPIPESPAGD